MAGGRAVMAEPVRVRCTGLVLSDPCGMHDHGRLLAAELRRSGLSVEEEWPVNDGVHLRPALAAAWRLLRSARRSEPGSTVVWHYSSFGCAWRGIPLFGVLLGLLLRVRGVRVVTFLHEPALPWNRRLDRRTIVSLAQWVALRIVVAGSSVLVVTTNQRASRLRWVGKAVHVIPVFSNIPVVADRSGPENRPPESTGRALTLGVVG